jgi:thymidylate synthase (FAD)
MKRVNLKVEILAVTPKALSVAYAACRQCYSSRYAADIYNDNQISCKKKQDFVKNVVLSGHESPIEHVVFTFAVEGVSRVLTHQLVRHRIASYSQQSQRYIRGSDFNFILPPSMNKVPEVRKKFLNAMKRAQKDYNDIFELLEENGITDDKAKEDARFLLPNAVETKIVISMNCRELMHFFSQRCCNRSQWEIRNLANKMLALCTKALPAVFLKAGAKCERLKFCPEGEKFSCGRYPAQNTKEIV